MRARGLGRRGATMLELLFGLGAMAALTLVIATMFRIGTVANRATTVEAEILSNARKALFGHGALPGIAREARYATQITTAATSSLCLQDSAGAVSTYTVTAAKLVRSRQGQVVATAEGVSSLSLAYYKVTGNYDVTETNDPALARMVTYSLVLSRRNRDVTLWSGRRLNNRR